MATEAAFRSEKKVSPATWLQPGVHDKAPVVLTWKIHKPRRTRRKNEYPILEQLNIFVTFVFFVVNKIFWINFTQVSELRYHRVESINNSG